jgi:hypothetical protein
MLEGRSPIRPIVPQSGLEDTLFWLIGIVPICRPQLFRHPAKMTSIAVDKIVFIGMLNLFPRVLRRHVRCRP